MKSIAQANVIAQWIEQTRGGDEGAAAELWQHCYFRVAAFARKRMRGAPIAIADEEDIATSAMKSLCVGLRAGKFQSLNCDDSLWRLLLVITARKVFDQVNYATRSKRDVLRCEPQSRFESEDWLAQTILSRSPSPETEAAVSEQLDRLLHSLDHEDLRQVVVLKLDGFTNAEIAGRLGLSVSSIERKLRTIRSIWKQVQ